MNHGHIRYDEQQFRNPYLNPKEALGILDLRSLGQYKIKQGVLQQNLGRYYKFESAELYVPNLIT